MINFYESTTLSENDFVEALDFLSSDRGKNVPNTEKYASWCYRLAKRYTQTAYLFSTNSGQVLLKIDKYIIYPVEKIAIEVTKNYQRRVWGEGEVPKIKRMEGNNGVIIKFERI